MTPATAAAVLAESHAFESRILGEGNERLRHNEMTIGGPRCDHRAVTLIERIGGGLDDHATDYCACQQCGDRFVVTSYASRRDVDIRPMTPTEVARYAKL